MHISADTFDDLLRDVLKRLVKKASRIRVTRGDTTEITGVLLELSNPLARLSRTENKRVLFSGFGELLWYLAGSRELQFIQYYVSRYAKESDDGKTIYGAYGPRLVRPRGRDQITNVLKLLKARPNTRRAVIQLFDAADLAVHHTDVPCTCTLQFLIRGGRLHLLTSMRSNDAYIGLPHDVFAFTMLQEIMARSLNVEVGSYKHMVGSLHLYGHDSKAAGAYLKEGWQETVAMPRMPTTNPWPSIAEVVKDEKAIRLRGRGQRRSARLEPYWMDIVRLLLVFRAFKDHDAEEIGRLKLQMATDVFDPYIEQKRRTASRRGRASSRGDA